MFCCRAHAMKGIQGCQIFLFAGFGMGDASATMLGLILNLWMDHWMHKTSIGQSEEAWNG